METEEYYSKKFIRLCEEKLAALRWHEKIYGYHSIILDHRGARIFVPPKPSTETKTIKFDRICRRRRDED